MRINIALEHISFSRMSLWKSSKKAFEDRYFSGKKPPETDAMNLGKRVDDLLEGTALPDTIEEKILADNLQNILGGYSQPELKSTVKHKGKEYTLIGFPDSISTKEKKKYIVERKTGKNENCYKNARKQMIFYDTILKNSGEKPILQGQIEWIKTDDFGDGLQVTGETETIPQKWSDESIENMEKEIFIFINEVHHRYS